MIDYAERVDEVCAVLREGYAVTDRGAIEAILACHLPETGLWYPWLVLDTSYYSIQTQHGWFALGMLEPIPMACFRTVRPRYSNENMQTILNQRDAPRLFVEPEWESPIAVKYQLTRWKTLQQNCLHIKTPFPRTALTDPKWQETLRQSTQRALDSRFRTERPRMPVPPAPLCYFAELLQRLAPNIEDWQLLLYNLYSLAARRAYLFNKPAADADDWALVSRVMHDTVPHFTNTLIQTLADRSGYWGSLRPSYRETTIRREIERLRRNGVLHPWKTRWLLDARDSIQDDILALLRGDLKLA